jgi:hypothetical protein
MGWPKDRIEKQLMSGAKEIIIDLNEEGMIDSEIVELVSMINKSPSVTIKSLGLYGNNIGDKGAAELSKLKNVKEINLCHNNLRNEGVKSLVVSEAFQSLDLSDNKGITDDVVQFVLMNAKQHILIFSNTRITDANIIKINELTRKNKGDLYKDASDKRLPARSESPKRWKIESPRNTETSLNDEALYSELIQLLAKHGITITSPAELKLTLTSISQRIPDKESLIVKGTAVK